jgi:lipopolysaccharide transport system permease protein
VGAATNSVVDHAHIISKVYFPRLAIPVSTVLAAVWDFLLACLLLPILMYWNGVAFGGRVWLAPVVVVALFLTCLGPGLWCAALNVQFRDVRYLVAFALQLGLFATPVIYPLSMIPAQWRWLYDLNPMVGMVELFRWCLLPRPDIAWSAVISSAVVTLIALLSGLAYFRYVEHSMADVV